MGLAPCLVVLRLPDCGYQIRYGMGKAGLVAAGNGHPRILALPFVPETGSDGNGCGSKLTPEVIWWRLGSPEALSQAFASHNPTMRLIPEGCPS